MSAKILAITSKILKDYIKHPLITMLHEFCTRLAAEIRHLGYVSHRADVLLLFLVRCLTLIFAVMEVLEVPKPSTSLNFPPCILDSQQPSQPAVI
jgi:hypothetical protein